MNTPVKKHLMAPITNDPQELQKFLQLMKDKPEAYIKFRSAMENYIDVDSKIEAMLRIKTELLKEHLDKEKLGESKVEDQEKESKKKASRNESKYILEILQDARKRTHLDASSRIKLVPDRDAFNDSRILRTNWRPSLITPNLLVLDACVPPDAPNHLYPEDPYRPTRLEKTFNLDNMLDQNLLPKVYEILGFDKSGCFTADSSSGFRYSYSGTTKSVSYIQKLDFVSDALESEIEVLKESYTRTKSIMYLEKMYQFRYGILGLNLVRSFLDLALLNNKSLYMRFRHNITD